MKTVTYADILKIYSESDRNYICHVVTEKYPTFDTDKLLEAIGIDAYGPVLGRLAFWKNTKLWSWTVLTLIYPHLTFFLKLPAYLQNEDMKTYGGRRAFRLAVLEALVKKCPERTFQIQEAAK